MRRRNPIAAKDFSKHKKKQQQQCTLQKGGKRELEKHSEKGKPSPSLD